MSPRHAAPAVVDDHQDKRRGRGVRAPLRGAPIVLDGDLEGERLPVAVQILGAPARASVHETAALGKPEHGHSLDRRAEDELTRAVLLVRAGSIKLPVEVLLGLRWIESGAQLDLVVPWHGDEARLVEQAGGLRRDYAHADDDRVGIARRRVDGQPKRDHAGIGDAPADGQHHLHGQGGDRAGENLAVHPRACAAEKQAGRGAVSCAKAGQQSGRERIGEGDCFRVSKRERWNSDKTGPRGEIVDSRLIDGALVAVVRGGRQRAPGPFVGHAFTRRQVHQRAQQRRLAKGRIGRLGLYCQQARPAQLRGRRNLVVAG